MQRFHISVVNQRNPAMTRPRGWASGSGSRVAVQRPLRRYATSAGLSIRARAGYDPRSKYKGEAGVVKYVKDNVLNGEKFNDVPCLQAHLSERLEDSECRDAQDAKQDIHIQHAVEPFVGAVA